MSMTIALYIFSTLFILFGLFGIGYAFVRKMKQVEVYDKDAHPAVKDYGPGFYLLLGAVWFLGGVCLFILSKTLAG